MLGVYIDNKLNFDYHVDQLCKKANKKLRALANLWNFNVHSHHIIYLLYKLTHVCRICKICLLQSTNNVLSEATILVRSSQQKWSIKSLFLKISKYSQENTNVLWSLFLTKLQDWSPATLFKIDPNTDLPCEYCEILKSTYVEDLRTATSAFFKSIF